MTEPRMHLIEAEILQTGIFPVSGTDEAGRGPLAGPVCAATVILNPHRMPSGLKDSKKVTARQRPALFDEIVAHAVDWSYAFASVAEIDEHNILVATRMAMLRSFQGLRVRPAYALVDGTDVPEGLGCPARAVIDGDALSASCAAASIVAKTMQVRQAMAMHACNPEYRFDQHKGYGTAAHLEALRVHGVSPWHRRSFAPVRRIAADRDGRAPARRGDRLADRDPATA